MAESSPLLKAETVAARLNLARITVYQFAQRGILPCVKIGRSVRFRSESIEKYLDAREKIAYGKVA